jgi:Trk-type K+ transport system membrane component
MNRCAGFKIFPDFNVLSPIIYIVYAFCLITYTVPYEAMLIVTEERPQKTNFDNFQSAAMQIAKAAIQRMKSIFANNFPTIFWCFSCIIVSEYVVFQESRAASVSLFTIAFECVAAYSGVGISIGLVGESVIFNNIIFALLYEFNVNIF